MTSLAVRRLRIWSWPKRPVPNPVRVLRSSLLRCTNCGPRTAGEQWKEIGQPLAERSRARQAISCAAMANSGPCASRRQSAIIASDCTKFDSRPSSLAYAGRCASPSASKASGKAQAAVAGLKYATVGSLDCLSSYFFTKFSTRTSHPTELRSISCPVPAGSTHIVNGLSQSIASFKYCKSSGNSSVMLHPRDSGTRALVPPQLCIPATADGVIGACIVPADSDATWQMGPHMKGSPRLSTAITVAPRFSKVSIGRTSATAPMTRTCSPLKSTPEERATAGIQSASMAPFDAQCCRSSSKASPS
mmetsp:Transcript_30313/g.55314  ORF Transcript_30313/g.55314 Transcript_30313/m.55314 type:complete len:304 (-) Transcript_30313:619-1530(-)